MGLYSMPLNSNIDLLYPSAAVEKKRHKLKRLVKGPNSYFLDVKCFNCHQISTLFSHSQKKCSCESCGVVLCKPTGGKAKITEGILFSVKFQGCLIIQYLIRVSSKQSVNN